MGVTSKKVFKMENPEPLFFRSVERFYRFLKVKNGVFRENLQFGEQLILSYPENYSTQEIAACTSFSICPIGQRNVKLRSFYCIYQLNAFLPLSS